MNLNPLPEMKEQSQSLLLSNEFTHLAKPEADAEPELQNSNSHMLKHFKHPLIEGYEFFTVYQKTCETCGETVYCRMSITPKNMMDTERTACSCFNKPPEIREKKIIHFDNEFKAWDLLKDKYLLESCLTENAEQEKLLKNFKTYVERFTPGYKGLCLYGLTGRGKTHYALCLGNAIKEKNYSVIALRSVDLLNLLRRAYRSNEESKELNIMSALKSVDLLIIDDLGSEKPSGWVKEKLYEIIDARNGTHCSIYTTNLGGEELSKELGSAIASRVFGVGYAVAVKGRDRRQEKADFSDIGREVEEFEVEMK